MNPIQKTKLELKELASQIRKIKLSRKPKNVILYPELKPFQDGLWKLDRLRYEYRHQHIAYCEIRGRTRQQIETPKDDNKPNEDKITEYKNKLLTELEEYKNETLRSSQEGSK
jgi:hypothetical protein